MSATISSGNAVIKAVQKVESTAGISIIKKIISRYGTELRSLNHATIYSSARCRVFFVIASLVA